MSIKSINCELSTILLSLFSRIAADKAFLSENYVEGARRAAAIADKVTAKAYKKAGFVDPRG